MGLKDMSLEELWALFPITLSPYNPEWVFHIHVLGDNDEISFCDCLSNNQTLAKEYEALKLSLLPKYINNRDGYTDAKSDVCVLLLSDI